MSEKSLNDQVIDQYLNANDNITSLHNFAWYL